jgi:hypothetical protein
MNCHPSLRKGKINDLAELLATVIGDTSGLRVSGASSMRLPAPRRPGIIRRSSDSLNDGSTSLRNHYVLQRDAVEAARDLLFGVAHAGGNMSGLDAYRGKLTAARFYGADLRDLKEIAERVAKLKLLKETYDRTPDGQTDSVCDEMFSEEDWILDRLKEFDGRFRQFLWN